MEMTHRTDQLHFVVVPDGADAFLVMADPKSNAVPPGGIVVIPTLLAESYWAEPQRLRSGAGS
jgi:hypothetical protein